MRHRLIALPLAAFASLAIASVAVAGGWAEVSGTTIPTDPPAGQGTTIELRMLQHGVTPVSWPRLSVIATSDSGETFQTTAQPKGPEGTYVATINFPSEGEWTLSFESKDLIMEGAVTMNVAAPIAVAPPAAPAQPVVQPVTQPVVEPAPAATQTFDLMPLALLLVAGAVLIALAAAIARNRSGSADTQVSVRT